MNHRISMNLCPCHSQRSYSTCCKPLHKGAIAASPELLMRSRYSAYALCIAKYIMETTHKDSPHFCQNTSEWKKELLLFCKGTEFVGLTIISKETEGKTGTVTFLAKLMQNGMDASFEEKSLFKKMGKKWLYVQGIKTTSH